MSPSLIAYRLKTWKNTNWQWRQFDRLFFLEGFWVTPCTGRLGPTCSRALGCSYDPSCRGEKVDDIRDQSNESKLAQTSWNSDKVGNSISIFTSSFSLEVEEWKAEVFPHRDWSPHQTSGFLRPRRARYIKDMAVPPPMKMKRGISCGWHDGWLVRDAADNRAKCQS